MSAQQEFSELHVRKGRREDGPELAALVRDVLVEYGLPPDPDGNDADLMDVEAAYFDKGGFFEVLLDKGTIVGCYGLYPLANSPDESIVELRKMYFTPELRGRGWGRAVLRRAVEKAASMQFKAVHLETASQLKEAIALYRNFGFRQLPATPDVPRCDQVFELSLRDWAYSGPATRELQVE